MLILFEEELNFIILHVKFNESEFRENKTSCIGASVCEK